MPANLTPQYLEAEKRFKEAPTPEEQVAALQEMMAVIPKHKGTEKLRAELRRRLSALRKDSAKKKPGGRKDPFRVEREGARQLTLAGAPNSGKSSILARATHATPEIADYPFTTRAPIPGMLHHEDVQIQIVDLPPISPDHTDSWVCQAIRTSDAALWIVDLGDDAVLEQMPVIQGILARAHADLEERPTLIIGNKSDVAGARDREQIVREIYGTKFPLISFSARDAGDAEVRDLGRRVFEFLDLVRVYTKAPGRKATRESPFVLARGSTILDLAGAVHKELREELKFARVWGQGKVDGMMASRDFVLDDGDIVELHAT